MFWNIPEYLEFFLMFLYVLEYSGTFLNILECSGMFCNIDRQRRTERFFSLVLCRAHIQMIPHMKALIFSSLEPEGQRARPPNKAATAL